MEQQLTLERAAHLLTVHNRIEELQQQKIVTREGEAEIRALQQEFTSEILANARDLLGAFHLMKREYEPLMIAEAIRQRRVGEINTQYYAQVAARAKAQAGNMVELPKA